MRLCETGSGTMHCKKKWILLYVLLSLMLPVLEVHGQLQPDRRGSRVIDDTTRQVYGPNTSRYFYETDIFFNRENLRPIDTLIRNFHRNANYVQRFGNFYQDLGNIGTAIYPIYIQSPDQIGVRTGFHAYDLYWDADPVRYFDTKSPYTNLQLILGGQGRSITNVAFSRNINPRWNFGFNFRGIFADKQVQRRGKNDRTTRSNYYDLYTSYRNQDSTYQLLANFRRMRHRVNEFGGVKINPATQGLPDYFENTAHPWLTTASTEDLRTNFHLYHQYSLGRGLQFYHQFDRYKQKNYFTDPPNAAQNDFYDWRQISPSDSVRDRTSIRTVRNEAGIKGNLLKMFYNGYVAVRHYTWRYEHVKEDELAGVRQPPLLKGVPRKGNGNEFYLGGRIALDLDSLVQLTGHAEAMLSGDSAAGYRIEGKIRSKWFEASLKQELYEPAMIMQAYSGGHDYWSGHNFDRVQSTKLNGYLHYRSKVFNLSPGLTLMRLHNYVFFDKVSDIQGLQQVLPIQSRGNQVIASPEVRIGVTVFKNLTLTTQGIYTLLLQNDHDAIRVPELFVNSQLAYANIFFDGNLDMQAGIDFHWKSAYYARAYDPVIQQFYNQDEFLSPSYPIADVFVNAKIKRARIYFKYHNPLQLIRDTGYFPTPYYPGQRPIFDFGFDWSFYD